jgi:putative component of toxin-antitoxin plasmid stabilization module
MPKTRVLFFKDEGGQAPVLEWLRELRDKNAKAWANCRARIMLLSQFGHELRRPAADFLRDGIYELRAKQGHVQFRMLYFFHGRNVAVLSHSLTKEAAIPAVDIERTLERKRQFELEPEKHTYAED